MGLYRNISINFWSDAKIDDCFSAHEKYLYLYLMTNPHTNICGCYEVGQNQMAKETGLPWEELERLLKKMQDEHHVIRYSAETKEVLLLNWGRYNWSRSPKVKASVISVAQYIKHPEFRKYVLDTVDERIQFEPAESDTADKKKEPKKNREQIPDTREQIPESRDQITDSSKQKSAKESATDTPIGYRYHIDTVSESDENKDKNSDFDRFWNAYPRPIRIADAQAAFAEVDVPVEILLEAIEQQRRSEDWTKDNGKWIPSPAKWLKGRRWRDRLQVITDDSYGEAGEIY